VPYERPAVVHLADVVLTGVGEPIRDGGVVLDGRSVAHVGPRDALVAAYPDARTRVWRGVLTPGLVNAHTHLQYTDYDDLATSGLEFFHWIQTLSARGQRTTAEEWAAGARRGVHALFRSGTTCVADVVSHAPALAPVARSGLAGISFVEVAGADAARWPAKRADLLAAVDGAPSSRTVGLAPHTLYTVGTGVICEMAALAREQGRRMHVHAAETTHETDFVTSASGRFAEALSAAGFDFELLASPSGRSPVAELDRLGMLGPDVHVAHGVHVSAEDRAVLRERGTAVALCVRSNRLLGAGEPPVADYLAEGSPLAVGTDSAASSPDLDLLAELAALRELALRQGAPADGLDERLFALATSGGAHALGLDGRVGVLVPGVRADLAVFDVPTDGDPYAALVQHGAGRCVATVLAGRLVHRAA
jgi:cytosine/adenosine deaminase-related metal-dependent hydrolase